MVWRDLGASYFREYVPGLEGVNRGTVDSLIANWVRFLKEVGKNRNSRKGRECGFHSSDSLSTV